MTKRHKKIKKKNPKAFKHFVNSEMLLRISKSIKNVYSNFNESEFLKSEKLLSPLELKQRVSLVKEKLKELLPNDYSTAIKILESAVQSGNVNGFELWPLTEFVQDYGLNNFEESIQAMYIMTQKFTAEFSIRPYLVHFPKKTYLQLLNWSQDPNEHVRRWTSEGTRPRLPWGIRLHNAVKDPSQGIKILENLKYDESLYVRKSVANHLNDISKDHPKMAIQLAKSWQKNSPAPHQKKIEWIISRGLRTLIKKGDPHALALIGSSHKVKFKFSSFKIKKSTLLVGENLEFSFKILSKSRTKQKFTIDYALYFLKSNGKHYRKVFKLKTFDLPGQNEVTIEKRHSLKPITTMKYYPGIQFLEIQINGNRISKKKLILRHLRR